LPDAKSERKDGIQFRFSFSVPVFTTSSPEAAPAQGLAWSLSGSTLTARNTGSSRAKLSALRLVGTGPERPVANGNLVYVLAGASMQWQLGSAPAGGALRIRGHDDRSGRDIEAPVGRS